MLDRMLITALVLIAVAGFAGSWLFHPEKWSPSSPQTVTADETVAEKSARILQEQVEALRVYPVYQYSIPVARSPQALAVADGILYISYQRLNMVDVLDYQGTRLAYFDPYPNGPINIGSLAVDIWNNLYLVDVRNHAILVFDPEHRFQGFFPPQGRQSGAEGALQAPVALAINRNNVFVADMGSNMLKAFLVNGDFVLAVPGTGKGDRQPWHPGGVAVATDGRLLVSDLKNKNVAVFNCIGEFAHLFARTEGKPQLLTPGGMAIDGSGRVHVLDAGSQAVFVYDNYGRFLLSYGGIGNGPSRLQSPMGLAIDKEKKLIFIADTGNREIDVWAVQ